MKKFIRRLLRGDGNKQRAQGSKPTDGDPEPKPTNAKSATSSKPSRRSHGGICPNEKCGKPILAPLTLKDLSQDQSGTYRACPYCLSRLNAATAEHEDAAERGPTEEPTSPEKNNREETRGSEKCIQYLGYLRERPKNAPIPDECLICLKSVECLLG